MEKINYIALDEYGKKIIEKIKNNQRYQEVEQGLKQYGDDELLNIIIGNNYIAQNKNNSLYLLKDIDDDKLVSSFLDILLGSLTPGLIGTDLKDLIDISKDNNICHFNNIEFNNDFSNYQEKVKELLEKTPISNNMVVSICYKEDIPLLQVNEIIKEIKKYQNVDTVYSCHKDNKNCLTIMTLTK